MGDTLHDLTGNGLGIGQFSVVLRIENEPSCGFAAVSVEMSLKFTEQAERVVQALNAKNVVPLICRPVHTA